jgi:hypothetical protein
MEIYLYLIFISIILASLHMIAPDHWLPITILASKRKYNSSRTGVISLIIGFSHGAISLALSLLVAYAGIDIFGVRDVKIGSIILLIIVSVYIFINTVKERKISENVENSSLVVSFLPDPAFLPIILLAISEGTLFTGLLGLLFVIVSGFSLFTVVLLVQKSIIKKIENLEPVIVDYVVIIVLLLTAAFIWFA